MKLIAHRGNLYGPNLNEENHPSYISNAIKAGYDVEIDVWFVKNKWYLGHDAPQYNIKYDFLTKSNFWLHAKNGDAFYELLKNHEHNVFWHTNEDWVLTSKKYIWTYPQKTLFENSICVLPELGFCGDLKKCYAICTDYVIKYTNI